MPKEYEEFYHLETERLLLRPFTEADYPLILRISSDQATTEYLYFWGRIGSTPESDAKRYLEYAMDSWSASPIRAREFCLVVKETGEAIGNGSVEWAADEPGTAELGWILLPGHRGKGYATEAGRELIRAAFEIMGADTVIAHCDSRNRASRNVMERLGMTLRETVPEARPAKRAGEKKGDECTYALNRESSSPPAL
ncbi:MAG: GNAT family N-acetyltransferase [Clostridia bacterium]|nr:GNAT family N-acetyltransferase [Clostridia bacterium]